MKHGFEWTWIGLEEWNSDFSVIFRFSSTLIGDRMDWSRDIYRLCL